MIILITHSDSSRKWQTPYGLHRGLHTGEVGLIGHRWNTWGQTITVKRTHMIKTGRKTHKVINFKIKLIKITLCIYSNNPSATHTQKVIKHCFNGSGYSRSSVVWGFEMSAAEISAATCNSSEVNGIWMKLLLLLFCHLPLCLSCTVNIFSAQSDKVKSIDLWLRLQHFDAFRQTSHNSKKPFL